MPHHILPEEPTVNDSSLPIIVGHRGAMGTCVENTLTAFHTAVAEGAGAIELDVRKCGSGELLVIHNHTLRYQDREAEIERLTWSELRSVKLPNPHRPGDPETIPLLGDVFEDMKLRDAIDTGLTLCVEIKSHSAATEIARYIQNAGLVDQSIVYSFNPTDLVAVQSVVPAMRTNLLFGKDRDVNLALASDIAAWSVNPEAYDTDTEYVRRAHDAGLRVSVGRTNDEAELKRVLRLDVWGVHTDFPGRGVMVRDRASSER